MSELLRPLLERVRALRPVDPEYLFFAGYLTPNGELHLGHIGGPYLRSDAAARCLRLHGARVSTMTASDCYESSVAYASATSGTAPDVIADTYTRRASAALAGLDITQTVFINGSTPEYADRYRALCHGLGRTLADAGRLIVREERLFATGVASPEYAVSAFLGGTCLFCGSTEAGNVCEQCGRWLPPESLDRPWQPPGAASPPERRGVRSVFVAASPDFAAAGEQGRVEPEYAYLTRDHVTHYGASIRLTYPLPWGVAWDVPGVAPSPGSVHSSYVTGKYASTRLVGQAYADRYGTDPFARDATVTTVAIGGLDSAMGWLAMLALTGPELDFRPFDHTVVNRFMLLSGSKFSTSRRHVIRVNDALDEGLSPDAVRLALARISPATEETDFVPAEVAKQSHEDAARLDQALRHLRDAAPDADAGQGAGQDALRDVAVDCLLRQREAFLLPTVDLPAAVDALMRWVDVVCHGQARDAPALARDVLAALANPLIPRWAAALWHSTPRPPGDEFGPAHEAAPTLRPLTADKLEQLVERART